MKKYVFLTGIMLFLTSCISTMPLTTTSNSINQSDKVGVSKSVWLLGMIPLSGDDGEDIGGSGIAKGVDQSIFTAAKKGGIDKISTVEERTTKKLFGLIVEYETIVHGY